MDEGPRLNLGNKFNIILEGSQLWCCCGNKAGIPACHRVNSVSMHNATNIEKKILSRLTFWQHSTIYMGYNSTVVWVIFGIKGSRIQVSATNEYT